MDNTGSDLIREEEHPAKEESSDINTNDLTDMEREKLPPAEPIGEVASRPLTPQEPNKAPQVSKPPSPGSKESILARLKEENESQ